MAQTSLHTLLSATASCPRQLLAMQCHSSCWVFAGHIQQALTALGTSHEGQADHCLGGGCSPALPAEPQDRAAWEPGTGHLPCPAALTPGFGLFVGGFHCNLLINRPFLQRQAAFPLCPRDRDRGQTRGELPWGRGQRYDHAGWPCTWSHEEPNIQHMIILEKKKEVFAVICSKKEIKKSKKISRFSLFELYKIHSNLQQ